MILTKIFYDVDNFCKKFEPKWEKILIGKNNKFKSSLSLSEIITILIYFHHSGYRTFKDYYTRHVMVVLKPAFSNLVSYSRFVSLIKQCIFPIFVYSQGCLGKATGISFMDSTILTVCHARRISSHKVFKKLAKRGKTSTGWFFGFKLHVIINERGEIINYMLTSGNVDDRKPVLSMTKGLIGKLFCDKGYLSQKLFIKLYKQGLQIITIVL